MNVIVRDKASFIHQLLENQASIHPNSPAVLWNEQILTYRELNERANQLAHFLKSINLQENKLVGLCLERSLETIVSILGVLKSGCAYVPINPELPKERIVQMLQDANPPVLLTQASVLDRLPDTAAQVICLDKIQEEISTFPKNNLKCLIDLPHLAYVIYTSGSTGIPKGVMVSHQNLINAFTDWKFIYQLEQSDHHLQMANYAFDVFTGDWVRTLCSGGKLVLCSKHILLRPEKLYAFMVKEKVNCAEFVPTILRKLFEYCKFNNLSLSFMRLIVCGSDSWSISEHRTLQQFCGKDTRVINSYGLTEATIDSTYFEEPFVKPKQLTTPHAALIGKPFPHTKIFLLDQNLQAVPEGDIGEIYIGGPGVAIGYLNQPDLTAAKFISNPFSHSDKEKLYKTGDRGRYLEDGNIEFIGRIDNQVKLRGIRIELGEIENAINCFPGIRENLVIVVENEKHHQKLVAYVVIEQEKKLDVQSIRHFLGTHLALYMIPSVFIRLDTLPVTPNGKLNRQLLKNTPLLLDQTSCKII